MTRASDRLAVFVPSFEHGGVERMLVNLSVGLARAGARVDFVVKHGRAPYLDLLPDGVRVIELDGIDADTLAAATGYFRTARPGGAIPSKDENDALALAARARAAAATRIALRAPVHISARLRMRGRGWLKRWLVYRGVRRRYRRADRIIAVSAGVAADIAAITGIARERIAVIHNPVITPELEGWARAPLDHPWFARKERPVILGIGRLGRQKNFELLLEAFARLRAARPARLVILGEGRRRSHLERRAARLGIAAHVSLPGFAVNPYAYLSRADLFVLSSDWEGSPNALTEALALGVPAVATDCESGPREILQDGRYGRLVPLGDAAALAEAMGEALAAHADPERLKRAVADYTVDASARRYLEVLDLNR